MATNPVVGSAEYNPSVAVGKALTGIQPSPAQAVAQTQSGVGSPCPGGNHPGAMPVCPKGM